jgi:hypothetical protein
MRNRYANSAALSPEGMRIVVWNCFRRKLSIRLEEPSAFQPYVVVIPEARAPDEESYRLVWWGRAGELGTAALTPSTYRVISAPLIPGASASAVPLLICDAREGALATEQIRGKMADRGYWAPLRSELETLRHERRKSSGS